MKNINYKYVLGFSLILNLLFMGHFLEAREYKQNPIQTIKSPIPIVKKVQPETIDQMLSRCPTNQEMIEIRRDFNIYFDNDVPLTSWTCTNEGNESSIMLSVYNTFRALKLLRFNEAIPFIEYDNFYDWLLSLNINFHIFNGSDSDYSWGAGNTLHIKARVMTDYSKEWTNPSSGVGIDNKLALVIHEARHTDPAGAYRHTCGKDGSNDTTLSAGGAWSLQYYYWLWLQNHSGNFLTPTQKEFAGSNARNTLERFCE